MPEAKIITLPFSKCLIALLFIKVSHIVCIGIADKTLVGTLFFSIAFYATGIPWFTLAIGDLIVKVLVALLMLIPFRILFNTFRPI